MMDLKSNRAATIDIGSNSIRLVIYDVLGASILPTFNEKVMAGLGKGLAETGRLSEKGKVAGIDALERFYAILKALGLEHFSAVATAAVREAEDGPEWRAQAERVLGRPISILSGEDEARVSAMGVQTSVFQAKGVVGDLGGSSVEFKQIGADAPQGESHLLGPLSLAGLMPDLDAVRQTVRAQLKQSKVLKNASGDFYAVGGAWRALASLSMEMDSYPLRVLHEYEMTVEQVSRVTKLCLKSLSDENARKKVQAVSKRRTSTMPIASIVLEEAIRVGGFDRIVVSSSGLREGVLVDLTGAAIVDPLVDGVIAFARLSREQIAFGQALIDFTAPSLAKGSPVFETPENDARIFRAACMMADIAGRFHPDHRANMAYYQALRAPYSAVRHSERAFIASAVGRRYGKYFKVPAEYQRLLTADQAQRAKQLGSAMRLGAVFSGSSGPILKRATLERSKKELKLIVNQADAAMVSESVRRRLEQTANTFDLDASVVIRSV
ncbi:MAG: Ppx/GppA family phosphatase [Hyphomonas sp.]